MSTLRIPMKRDEMAELLGLDTDFGIERVDVSFSPMMDEWYLTVDFDAYEADPVQSPEVPT